MGRRIEQLDSLRGLAALTVVLYHLFLMLPAFDSRVPATKVEALLISSPIGIIWAGHQAVILFFVLSGYVLSLPFFRRQVKYTTFVVKRVCRIYIPYVMATLIALMIRTRLVHGGTLSGLSGYFNREWTTPLTWSNITDHIIMIGPQFNTDTLDSPIWSLIHEMRISLIFPALMICIMRFRWQINIVLGVLVTFVGIVFQYIYHSTYQPVYKSLPYMLMFILGALLAKNSDKIAMTVSRMSLGTKVAFLVVGLLCYNTSDWVLNRHILQLKAFDDLETLVGSVVIITLALNWKGFSLFLLTRPLRFLGRISYSLYLFHAIVLFSLTYTMYHVTPLWLLWIVILVTSLCVSALSYYWIEIPSIKLGRILVSLSIPRKGEVQIGTKS